ncbi:MAG: GAF domain-containing protein [Candidatus Zixiibacteriota bacterium]
MHVIIIELMPSLIFLAFSFLIVKLRHKYFEHCPQSWRMLAWGGLALLGAAVTKFVYSFYNLAGSTWYSFIFSIEIFGYVTGAGLVLFGFLKWASVLLNIRKAAALRLRQLTCIKAVLSMLNHSKNLDEIFKEFLPCVMNVMQYKMGVIFKPTFRSPEMILVTHWGITAKNLSNLYNLYSTNPLYQETAKSKEVTTASDAMNLPEYGILLSPEDGISSFACVPIKFCGKLLGLLGIYDLKPNRFTYQEIQFLTSLGETLGLAAKQILTSERNKKRRDYISCVENISKVIQDSLPLEEALHPISTELKKIIDFDYISLAIADRSGQNIKRLSKGTSGGVLLDKRTSIPAADTIVGKVIKSGEAWIEEDIRSSSSSIKDENYIDDGLLKACGIRSSLILPLGFKGSVCGVLSLGHPSPGFYSPNDAKWLKPFTQQLSLLIHENRLVERLRQEEHFALLLSDRALQLIQDEDIKAFLNEVASGLTEELPKSFVRITLLNREREHLTTQALHQIRKGEMNLRKMERFPLKDMPWHRLTLETKRTMLINQDDPESLMPDKEAGLILDKKIKSALLVPLILNGKAVGIISLGEMRNWERQPFTQEETNFIKHLSSQVSLALKKGLLLRSNERMREKLKELEKKRDKVEAWTDLSPSLSDLRYEVSNPLSSILGSAELLRLKEPNISPENSRYIRNIERGADRIQKVVEKFLDSVRSDQNQSLN